jgi:cyclopropane-fatty-acyl-phospholipid synthase
MSEQVRKVEVASAQKTLRFVQALLQDFQPRDFTVELWDGSRWAPEKNQFDRWTWRINSPETLRSALFSANRQVALAEAYVYGDFDIVGDIEAVFPLADYLINKPWSAKEKLSLMGMVLGLPAAKRHSADAGPRLVGRLHSKKRDQQAVSYHYDVSNDFYALWLDQNMAYSCAYFEHADDDIDTAQTNKFDYICRKLRLQPGERLLDIGCGWGGLLLHAVRQYGVRALGVTLSRQQFELAQKRIAGSGLAERCEVRLVDYRDLDEPGGFDKLVSVGMVEHVGESHLPEYFRQAFRLLRPGGLFLNAGIGRAGCRPLPDKPTYTDLYIFPDGDLPAIGNLLTPAEQAGFEVRDVENLREHYHLTLKHWLRRLQAHDQEARRLVGETKYRMWRLYLAGSAHYFQSARLNLYHTLLVKDDNGQSHMPLTRADWYRT